MFNSIYVQAVNKKIIFHNKIRVYSQIRDVDVVEAFGANILVL